MKITAIIVTHNSAEVIRRALSSICPHDEIGAYLVVDNASNDTTRDIIRAEFPQVQIMENAENVGYGAACNRALERVTSEYALIMNPDASIDEKGISRLLDVMVSYPNAAIAAPWLPQQNMERPVLKQLEEEVWSVPFIAGALMLWRMETMRRVGFFDPAFFLFYEDDDLSIRTRGKGYQMLLVSGITCFHTPGKSSEMTEELSCLKLESSIWSRLYLTRKYRGRLIAVIMAGWQVVNSWLYYIFSREPHKKIMHRSKLQGAIRFLHNPASFR